MNRRVIHTAFGRGGSQCTRAGVARRESRQLSTSTAFFFDDQPQRPASSRERSEAVASKLGQLNQSRTPPSAPSGAPGGGVDARSLAAKPFNKLLVASPRINNLRSLRERGGSTGTSFGARPPPRRFGADGANTGSSFGARGGGERGGFGGAPRPSAGFRPRGDGSAGARGGARFGAREGGARGRGNARGGRGRGRGRGARRGGDKKDTRPEMKKLEWTPEEQAVHDRLDQGVVTEYTPSMTLESLIGYGPALATDAALGNVETAMRNMRVLGGGRPFDTATGVTSDPKAAVKRYYHEKKPLFFNTPEEKAFLEHSIQGFKIAAPQETTKKVIVDTAILGKYEAPKFAPVGDVLGTLASFHARDVSYHKWETKAFTEKVKSLLPAAAAAKPAARAKKTA